MIDTDTFVRPLASRVADLEGGQQHAVGAPICLTRAEDNDVLYVNPSQIGWFHRGTRHYADRNSNSAEQDATRISVAGREFWILEELRTITALMETKSCPRCAG